jgi:hypothetical protein
LKGVVGKIRVPVPEHGKIRAPVPELFKNCFAGGGPGGIDDAEEFEING